MASTLSNQSNADDRQHSTLKTLYDEVLLAFEEALDEAEDLISSEPSSNLRNIKTWLENATSSLISWGIDARTDAGSLSAVEGTPLENKLRCSLRELQGQLAKIYEECKFREEVRSLPENVSSVVPESPPIYYGDRLAADKDSMAIMSSLLNALQDLVRPIRMIHASRGQAGPYQDLKRQIDKIYTHHTEQRDRSELREPESLLDITAHEDGQQYKHTGKMEDLKEAIRVSRQAVDITPEDYPHLATCIKSLRNKLERRYERTGKMEDLEEAIRVS